MRKACYTATQRVSLVARLSSHSLQDDHNMLSSRPCPTLPVWTVCLTIWIGLFCLLVLLSSLCHTSQGRNSANAFPSLAPLFGIICLSLRTVSTFESFKSCFSKISCMITSLSSSTHLVHVCRGVIYIRFQILLIIILPFFVGWITRLQVCQIE